MADTEHDAIKREEDSHLDARDQDRDLNDSHLDADLDGQDEGRDDDVRGLYASP